MIFSPTDSRPGEHLHPELLAQLADDVRQLTTPFRRVVWRQREVGWWDKNRNWKKRTHRWSSVIEYPSLLDQLRAAVHPTTVPRRAERAARVPASKVPISVDPASRLGEIYVEVGKWVARTGRWPEPGAEDWFEQALRGLVGAAAELPRREGETLVADVRRWWGWAAVQAGWNEQELLDERSGL